MEESYVAFPAVISYVKDTWLNNHKEKFVKFWTNGVLHFGNVTNCRVEIAHSTLKGWLETSTGSLDSVWAKVNKAIEDQVTQIKQSLERSRRSHGRIYDVMPLQHLNGRTSHHCMLLLVNEKKRMRELSHEVNVRCGCVYKTTHQIPCACDIRRAIDSGTYFYLDQVHPFYRTLVIGEDGCVPTPLDDPDHQSQDSRFFESFMHEPPRNTTTRGKPQSNSTRRNRSAWEYTRGTRGRRGRNGGRGDGGRSGGGRDISDFPYLYGLPDIIKPFVEDWNNVMGDGNCGFRCVADFFLGGQDNWIQARYLIVNEVKANRPEYIHLYHGGLDQAIDRITWNGGHCGANHYMDLPDDLYPIANFWNCAVMVYGVGPRGELYSCMTVLPLRAPSTDDRPRIEICHYTHWSPLCST
uniref:Protein FAR1-RELATED SEQUENCE n=2 Tax=Chenopodium quinoa TaxID=63459 RepID=A0A803L9G5_CHEQI